MNSEQIAAYTMLGINPPKGKSMNIQTCKFVDASDFFQNDKFDVFSKMVEDTDWIIQGNFNRSLLDKDSVILLLNCVTLDDVEDEQKEEEFNKYVENIIEQINNLPNDVFIDMEN